MAKYVNSIVDLFGTTIRVEDDNFDNWLVNHNPSGDPPDLTTVSYSPKIWEDDTTGEVNIRTFSGDGLASVQTLAPGDANLGARREIYESEFLGVNDVDAADPDMVLDNGEGEYVRLVVTNRIINMGFHDPTDSDGSGSNSWWGRIVANREGLSPSTAVGHHFYFLNCTFNINNGPPHTGGEYNVEDYSTIGHLPTASGAANRFLDLDVDPLTGGYHRTNSINFYNCKIVHNHGEDSATGNDDILSTYSINDFVDSQLIIPHSVFRRIDFRVRGSARITNSIFDANAVDTSNSAFRDGAIEFGDNIGDAENVQFYTFHPTIATSDHVTLLPDVAINNTMTDDDDNPRLLLVNGPSSLIVGSPFSDFSPANNTIQYSGTGEDGNIVQTSTFAAVSYKNTALTIPRQWDTLTYIGSVLYPNGTGADTGPRGLAKTFVANSGYQLGDVVLDSNADFELVAYRVTGTVSQIDPPSVAPDGWTEEQGVFRYLSWGSGVPITENEVSRHNPGINDGDFSVLTPEIYVPIQQIYRGSDNTTSVVHQYSGVIQVISLFGVHYEVLPFDKDTVYHEDGRGEDGRYVDKIVRNIAALNDPHLAYLKADGILGTDDVYTIPGVWDPDTTYDVADAPIVEYPADSNEFFLLEGDSAPPADFSTATTYNEGDVVTEGTEYYILISSHLLANSNNDNPSADTTNWESYDREANDNPQIRIFDWNQYPIPTAIEGEFAEELDSDHSLNELYAAYKYAIWDRVTNSSPDDYITDIHGPIFDISDNLVNSLKLENGLGLPGSEFEYEISGEDQDRTFTVNIRNLTGDIEIPESNPPEFISGTLDTLKCLNLDLNSVSGIDGVNLDVNGTGTISNPLTFLGPVTTDDFSFKDCNIEGDIVIPDPGTGNTRLIVFRNCTGNIRVDIASPTNGMVEILIPDSDDITIDLGTNVIIDNEVTLTVTVDSDVTAESDIFYSLRQSSDGTTFSAVSITSTGFNPDTGVFSLAVDINPGHLVYYTLGANGTSRAHGLIHGAFSTSTQVALSVIPERFVNLNDTSNPQGTDYGLLAGGGGIGDFTGSTFQYSTGDPGFGTTVPARILSLAQAHRFFLARSYTSY